MGGGQQYADRLLAHTVRGQRCHIGQPERGTQLGARRVEEHHEVARPAAAHVLADTATSASADTATSASADAARHAPASASADAVTDADLAEDVREVTEAASALLAELSEAARSSVIQQPIPESPSR